VSHAEFNPDAAFAPFWCPGCHGCYCRGHWETWDLYYDGFFDEKRGRRPNGHERKLLD
jgi:hypothetical protein